MLQRLGCAVHAFDLTPRSVTHVDRRREAGAVGDAYRFYPWASPKDAGRATLFLPAIREHVTGSLYESEMTGDEGVEVECRSLPTIMETLGHDRIDLLKIDIEGAEYEVVEDLIARGSTPGQLLFEVHESFFEDGRARTERLMTILERAGYRGFAVDRYAREYSLIHESVL